MYARAEDGFSGSLLLASIEQVSSNWRRWVYLARGNYEPWNRCDLSFSQLPSLHLLLGASQPVSDRMITGALGWTLAYMIGCSPYESSSVIAKVDTLTRRTVNELSMFLRTIFDDFKMDLV